MSKASEAISNLIRDHAACVDSLSRIARESEHLSKRREEAKAELEKLLVSTGHKEAVYNGLRYFMHNGLQVESYCGIIVEVEPESSEPKTGE